MIIYGLKHKHKNIFILILRKILPHMNTFIKGDLNKFIYWHKEAMVFEIYFYGHVRYYHIPV